MFSGTATEYLGLPNWQGGDHPSFLEDMNNAFRDIDRHYGDMSVIVNNSAGLINDAIPVIEELAQKLPILDTREESDRAFLQSQVDQLKKQDIAINGLIDQIQLNANNLGSAVEQLVARVVEEEATTAGFTSAAGNTIKDRMVQLDNELTEQIQALQVLRTEYDEHYADFNKKYSDLETRMLAVEAEQGVQNNRLTALEDWKSPFSQQVASLEERYGEVTADAVDIHKRMDLLQTQLTALDTDIHNLRSEDTRIAALVKNNTDRITETHTLAAAADARSTSNQTLLGTTRSELGELEDRVDAVENKNVQQDTTLGEHTGQIHALQDSVRDNKADADGRLDTLGDNVGALDTELHGHLTDYEDLVAKVTSLESYLAKKQYTIRSAEPKLASVSTAKLVLADGSTPTAFNYTAVKAISMVNQYEPQALRTEISNKLTMFLEGIIAAGATKGNCKEFMYCVQYYGIDVMEFLVDDILGCVFYSSVGMRSSLGCSYPSRPWIFDNFYLDTVPLEQADKNLLKSKITPYASSYGTRNDALEHGYMGIDTGSSITEIAKSAGYTAGFHSMYWNIIGTNLYKNRDSVNVYIAVKAFNDYYRPIEEVNVSLFSRYMDSRIAI